MGTQRSRVIESLMISSVEPGLELIQGSKKDDAAASALAVIVNCVWTETGASGAALALESSGKVICCARAGESAPTLGAELNRESGISGLCLRTADMVRCTDAAADARVDAEAAKNLGIASILAVPVIAGGKTVGLLEVFSREPNAFGIREEGILLAAVAQVLPSVNGESETAAQEQFGETHTSRPAADSAAVFPGFSDVLARKPNRLLIYIAALVALLVIGGILISGLSKTSRGKVSSQVESLTRTAQQGDASAQYYLALRYRDGDGLAKDDGESVRWLKEAARQGNGDAQYELGNAYLNGRGVDKDPVYAYACYALAGANGNVASEEKLKALTPTLTSAQVAQYRATVAEMYLQGRGTPQDYKAAYMWFTLAEYAGNPDSTAAKKALALKMSKAQMAAAQRGAEAWVKAHGQ